MSEVNIEALQNEVAQSRAQLRGYIAQLEAAKQMVNEGLNTSMQIRTNLMLMTQTNQETLIENAELKKQIGLNHAQIKALGAKILELSPPTESVSQPQSEGAVQPENSEVSSEQAATHENSTGRIEHEGEGVNPNATNQEQQQQSPE